MFSDGMTEQTGGNQGVDGGMVILSDLMTILHFVFTDCLTSISLSATHLAEILI